MPFSSLSPDLARHLAYIWYIFITVHFSFTSDLPHSTFKFQEDRGSVRYPHTPKCQPKFFFRLLLGYKGRGYYGRRRTLPQSLEAIQICLWILFIFKNKCWPFSILFVFLISIFKPQKNYSLNFPVFISGLFRVPCSI